MAKINGYLRRLRLSRGLYSDYVASKVGWRTAKLRNFEDGHISTEEARHWLKLSELYKVPVEGMMRGLLRDEARRKQQEKEVGQTGEETDA